jgi:hypothetical protein
MYVKVPPGSRRQRKPVSPRHNAFRPVFIEMKKGAAPLNWRLALRVLMRGIGIASFVMVVLGLMSGTIRSYVSMLIDRQVARAWPFTYAVVGDSLAAECPWKWSFGLSPLAATGGNVGASGGGRLAGQPAVVGGRGSATAAASGGGRVISSAPVL